MRTQMWCAVTVFVVFSGDKFKEKNMDLTTLAIAKKFSGNNSGGGGNSNNNNLVLKRSEGREINNG